MKLRFLCAPHRIEISNRPTMAINCWQNSFDTGQMLCDQQLLQEALPYLGCAFETAEIVLTTGACEAKQACQLFTQSAVLLAKTCAELGFTDDSMQIYQMAINRLEAEHCLATEHPSWRKLHLSYFYARAQCSDFSATQQDPEPLFAQSAISTAIH